eukprot:comp23545_c0_seq1/m.39729 comp23545_c0_seq1/g.39729  ORF comp23545_c0_seq1/g.39729 comp23545_c0_seq1/m.39729 type:complete len:611 (-) comp23545_c0_seq1:721-2553(-)
MKRKVMLPAGSLLSRSEVDLSSMTKGGGVSNLFSPSEGDFPSTPTMSRSSTPDGRPITDPHPKLGRRLSCGLSTGSLSAHRSKSGFLILESRGSKITDTPALSKAAYRGDLRLIEKLLSEGPYLDQADFVGRTALMEASTTGKTDAVRLLLEAGADIEKKDQFGETALSLASKEGHTEVVDVLLSKGADVNTTNMFHETPLMKASQKGQVATVELLLERGADHSITDTTHETALAKAMREGHPEIIYKLKEFGAMEGSTRATTSNLLSPSPSPSIRSRRRRTDPQSGRTLGPSPLKRSMSTLNPADRREYEERLSSRQKQIALRTNSIDGSYEHEENGYSGESFQSVSPPTPLTSLRNVRSEGLELQCLRRGSQNSSDGYMFSPRSVFRTPSMESSASGLHFGFDSVGTLEECETECGDENPVDLERSEPLEPVDSEIKPSTSGSPANCRKCSKMSDMATQIAELAIELEAVKGDRDAKEGEIERLGGEIRGLREQLESAEKEVEDALEREAAMRAKLEEVKREKEEREAASAEDMKVLVSALSSVTREREDVRREREALTRERELLQAERAQLTLLRAGLGVWPSPYFPNRFPPPDYCDVQEPCREPNK